MRVHFIVHGGRKAALKTESYLVAHQSVGHDFIFSRTRSLADVNPLVGDARKLAGMIVVIGGDGLFSLVVKALLRESGRMPILALIPSGSGNDFARNFGWKKNPDEFLKRLSRMETKWMDAGMVDNGIEKDYFINETSTGISNAVVRLVARKPSAWNGNLKFGWSILQAFFTFSKQPCEIEWNKGKWKGKAMLVACCNGKFFGSGVGIAPAALPYDAALNLVIIGNITIWHYLRFLPRLRRSEIIDHPEVKYVSTDFVKFLSNGKLERDGEPGLALPAVVSVLPKSLEVLI